MRRNYILIFLLVAIGFYTFGAERVTPYQGSRIFWDNSSKKMLYSSGSYARIIQLQDKRLMLVADMSGGVGIAFSSNLGTTWTNSQILVSSPSNNYQNIVPDLCQLKDGTILVAYNPRPLEPFTSDRPFGIRVIRSTDNGASWSTPIFVYDGKTIFNDGCWEPSMLELPSGELQLYFSNEGDYTSSNEQNIALTRSFDNGLTWSNIEVTSYRAGSRDGMPKPVLLQGNEEIVYTIEDNGWPGRIGFAVTTIRTTLEDNWKSGTVLTGSPKRNLIYKNIPDPGISMGAPYLAQLPNGETIASFQGSEGRLSVDMEYNDMFVMVGDKRAMNFKAQSRPFALDFDKKSIWNSVAVIDTGIVVALGNIGNPMEGMSTYMIKGYPKTQAVANRGTITVDGKYSSSEVWTTPNRTQLFLGNETKNNTTADFLYDDKYLYFTARVVDRTLVTTSTDNDGLLFCIDAHDASTASPQEGVYKIFFNTDGSLTMNVGDNGSWKRVDDTSSIVYAVDLVSSYYTIEAAIPWTALGHTSAPTTTRMGINLEITDINPIGWAKEGITEAKNNEPWSYLEFRLNDNGSAPIIEKDDVNVVTYCDGERLLIDSEENIKDCYLYSFDGCLINRLKDCYQQQIQIPLMDRHGGGVLKLLLEGGKVVNKKVMF